MGEIIYSFSKYKNNWANLESGKVPDFIKSLTRNGNMSLVTFQGDMKKQLDKFYIAASVSCDKTSDLITWVYKNAKVML